MAWHQRSIPVAPNARPELLPEAGAQRTLEAVSSRPLFGAECHTNGGPPLLPGPYGTGRLPETSV
jgi:hypothetical protein